MASTPIGDTSTVYGVSGRTMSLLVTVTSFCIRGGGGGQKGRNFAYVLNGCSLWYLLNQVIIVHTSRITASIFNDRGKGASI